MKDKDKDEIARVDGKNCFVKIRTGMLRKGKVILEFVQYQEKSFKLLSEIPYYMDIPDFLVLAEDISYGTLRRRLETEKQAAVSQKRYASAVWESKPSGTKKEDLAARGKSRADGMDEARALKIQPATKSQMSEVILYAIKGPGEQQGNGIIVPRFTTDDDTERIMVPMTYHALRGLFAVTVANIYGMFASGWSNGDYEGSYESKETAEPEKSADTYMVHFCSDFSPIGKTGGYSATIDFDGQRAELVVWADRSEEFKSKFGDSWYEFPFSGKKGPVKASRRSYKGTDQLTFTGFA